MFETIYVKQEDKSPWIIEAEQYMGMHEVRNEKELMALFDYVDMVKDGKYPGNASPRKQAWCAQFVSAVLAKCGIIPSGSTWWARSYLDWGWPLVGPVYGAIGILERGPVFGHDTFIVGKTKPGIGEGDLWGLGGNQSDMVKISRFPRKRFLGFRWPKGYPRPKIKLPVFDRPEAYSTSEA